MPTPSMSYSRLMVANVACALVLGTAARSLGAVQVHRTERPMFAVVDSVNPPDSVLRAYIRTLSFLSDHVSSDTRMLDAAHTSQIVRVEPAAGNNLVNADQLRSGGRVLARIVNRGTDAISRFALSPKGRTYVWVQYVREAWRGVLISTDSLGAVVGRAPIRVTPERYDHPARVLQPVARFITDSLTQAALAPCFPGCMPFGWCRADSLHTEVW